MSAFNILAWRKIKITLNREGNDDRAAFVINESAIAEGSGLVMFSDVPLARLLAGSIPVA